MSELPFFTSRNPTEIAKLSGEALRNGNKIQLRGNNKRIQKYEIKKYKIIKKKSQPNWKNFDLL